MKFRTYKLFISGVFYLIVWTSQGWLQLTVVTESMESETRGGGTAAFLNNFDSLNRSLRVLCGDGLFSWVRMKQRHRVSVCCSKPAERWEQREAVGQTELGCVTELEARVLAKQWTSVSVSTTYQFVKAPLFLLLSEFPSLPSHILEVADGGEKSGLWLWDWFDLAAETS